MGSCCSCCGSSSDDGEQSAQELELQNQKARKALAISTTMSAPTITRKPEGTISGKGLALAGVAIEQDAAYWEWHMKIPPKTTIDTILFGVSGKKDAKFYEELKDKVQPEEGTPSQVNGTEWMRRIDVENGDVIGVAVQQSDLPMVQFSLNGELLHISAINRFRGMVYPAIHLPESEAGLDVEALLVVDGQEFKHTSPGNRFVPLMVARSIV